MVLGLLAITGCRSAFHVHTEPLTPVTRSDQSNTFRINGHTLDPEIAMNPTARARGLQNRQPPSDGLILLFPTTVRQSIWMPNCPVDLEAWVIDQQGVILEIMTLPAERSQEANESQWEYHARLPRHRTRNASRVIWEFKAGSADRMNVVPGNRIDGNWPALMVNPG